MMIFNRSNLVKTKVDENGEKMDFIMRLVASFVGVDGKCALHIAASDGMHSNFISKKMCLPSPSINFVRKLLIFY